MSVPHYAEAFALRDGCFRFVEDSAGRPEHCPVPATRVGRYRNRLGRVYSGAKACDGHRGGLEQARRLARG